MTPDLDRLADEIVLMTISTFYAEVLQQEISPEVWEARGRIADHYRELKTTHPFPESERQAKAEVVADWLRRRLGS